MSERRTYPPDEFDRVQVSTRRGAHRGRPHPWQTALPVVAVLLTVGLVGWGFSTLLGEGSVESAITAPGEADQSADPQPAPSEAPTTPAPEPEPEPEPEPTAQVDRTVSLRVLNSTRIGGLAARGAQLLADAGWDVAGTDNYRAGTIATTVFFADPDLEVTALAVVQDLGLGRVVLDTDLGSDVTVVLGEDFSD